MHVHPEQTVGEIAAEYPLATRVFARHDIDFCCGGGSPLAAVCEERGLDPEAVRTEIEAVIAETPAGGPDWNTAPLETIIDHILVTYHRPLDTELPRLEGMARKVLAVHGDKEPERLSELLNILMGLKAELQSHMMKEEQILFPLIRSGQGNMADGPIAMMEQEHADAGEALRAIRGLTDDFKVPQGACMTWTALWHGLAAFEKATHEHIHLENNILFPRALAG